MTGRRCAQAWDARVGDAAWDVWYVAAENEQESDSGSDHVW